MWKCNIASIPVCYTCTTKHTYFRSVSYCGILVLNPLMVNPIAISSGVKPYIIFKKSTPILTEYQF